ncbi:MAG: 23S rRNA (pseudouridine(1915)-N(3))-methyltransferase RlmH [Candidatus Puniceispirillaceae bacterium]|jgi:23S rRNA (pseudouridine1915-N3)-methyltransferase
MKLVILAVGKGRNSPEHDLATSYIKRLPEGGEIREIDSKLPAGPKRQQDETRLLLRLVPDNAILVCLDPRGKDISSELLASKIGSWRDEGQQAVYFAIGGADGHDRDIHQRADLLMSFGSAIWPHMLFRAMLAEQLYRASAILSGHPYHRGN